MKRALWVVMMLACHRHEAEHEKDDSKKEGAHATVEDKRTAAEEAIHAYETAGSCDARAQTIVFGADHKDLLAKKGCASHKIERFDTGECDKLAGALTQCHATARRDGDKRRYWLVKQPNGQFLVDFLATERPMTLADAMAQLPATPTVLRVRIRTSSFYGKAFRGQNKTYLSLRVRSAKGDPDAAGYAFVRRDSPEGIALSSALGSAADDAEVTLALSFASKDREAAVVEKLFGMDFFETDAERTFATSDGGT
jgi:hypothetical protein